MIARVLGSAAGGGSPQWNCHCAVCTAVRAGAGPPRTQSSIAVTLDRDDWFLFNASPDVHRQIDGRQYVAVPVGWGGWAEGFLPGMLGAGHGSALIVFALPEWAPER